MTVFRGGIVATLRTRFFFISTLEFQSVLKLLVFNQNSVLKLLTSCLNFTLFIPGIKLKNTKEYPKTAEETTKLKEFKRLLQKEHFIIIFNISTFSLLSISTILEMFIAVAYKKNRVVWNGEERTSSLKSNYG